MKNITETATMDPREVIRNPLLLQGLVNLMQHFADSGRNVAVTDILPLPRDKHSPSFTVRLRFPGAESNLTGLANDQFRFAFQLETVEGTARARFISGPYKYQLNDLGSEAAPFGQAVIKNIADTGLITLPLPKAA